MYMDQVRAPIWINMEYYLNRKEIGLELEVELVSLGSLLRGKVSAPI